MPRGIFLSWLISSIFSSISVIKDLSFQHQLYFTIWFFTTQYLVPKIQNQWNHTLNLTQCQKLLQYMNMLNQCQNEEHLQQILNQQSDLEIFSYNVHWTEVLDNNRDFIENKDHKAKIVQYIQQNKQNIQQQLQDVQPLNIINILNIIQDMISCFDDKSYCIYQNFNIYETEIYNQNNYQLNLYEQNPYQQNSSSPNDYSGYWSYDLIYLNEQANILEIGNMLESNKNNDETLRFCCNRNCSSSMLVGFSYCTNTLCLYCLRSIFEFEYVRSITCSSCQNCKKSQITKEDLENLLLLSGFQMKEQKNIIQYLNENYELDKENDQLKMRPVDCQVYQNNKYLIT